MNIHFYGFVGLWEPWHSSILRHFLTPTWSCSELRNKKILSWAFLKINLSGCSREAVGGVKGLEVKMWCLLPTGNSRSCYHRWARPSFLEGGQKIFFARGEGHKKLKQQGVRGSHAKILWVFWPSLAKNWCRRKP